MLQPSGTCSATLTTCGNCLLYYSVFNIGQRIYVACTLSFSLCLAVSRLPLACCRSCCRNATSQRRQTGWPQQPRAKLHCGLVSPAPRYTRIHGHTPHPQHRGLTVDPHTPVACVHVSALVWLGVAVGPHAQPHAPHGRGCAGDCQGGDFGCCGPSCCSTAVMAGALADYCSHSGAARENFLACRGVEAMQASEGQRQRQ